MTYHTIVLFSTFGVTRAMLVAAELLAWSATFATHWSAIVQKCHRCGRTESAFFTRTSTNTWCFSKKAGDTYTCLYLDLIVTHLKNHF